MTLERPATGDAVAELDEQVERGSMFTQAATQKLAQRLAAAEAQIVELADALVRTGALAPADLPEVAAAIRRHESLVEEADARGDMERFSTWPAIAVREDSGDEAVGEPVDCAARMHICKAVCCTLRFPLSEAEVDARVVKWDIGHPYVIRQRSDGWCTHNDPASGACTVYEQRPAVCSRYTCRHDTRIWADFDGMVLNEAFIAKHLERGNGSLHLHTSQGAEADA